MNTAAHKTAIDTIGIKNVFHTGTKGKVAEQLFIQRYIGNMKAIGFSQNDVRPIGNISGSFTGKLVKKIYIQANSRKRITSNNICFGRPLQLG